jgi:hypothetical protein
MNAIEILPTSHAIARLRQRGLREDDALLIIELGAEIWPSVFMITDKQADALIAEIDTCKSDHTIVGPKSNIADLRRRIDALRQCAVVASGQTFVTVFHKFSRNLRADHKRNPSCCRRRQRRQVEKRKRAFFQGYR